jgi:hypothetical protein
MKALVRVAVALGVLVMMPLTAAASATRPVLLDPLVFRNVDGSLTLVVQVQPGRADLGAFDFIVSGVGDYRGQASVRSSGPNVLHLVGSGPARLITTRAVRSVTLRIDGELDTAHDTASVEVWVTGMHYHLGTENGQVADARRAAQRALTAWSAHNWPALYLMMEPRVQQTYTESQFAQLMNAAGQPQVIALRLNGTGVQEKANGYIFFKQPIAVQARKPDGTMIAFASNIYLVLENHTWYVMSTDAPPSS